MYLISILGGGWEGQRVHEGKVNMKALERARECWEKYRGCRVTGEDDEYLR